MINYLDYTYQSNKGETKAGDIFNGALKGSFSDKDYTSSFVNGEKIVATGTESTNLIPLAWTPVDTRAVQPYTNEKLRPVISVNGTELTEAEIGLPGEATTGKKVLVSVNGIAFTSGNEPSANDEIVVKYFFLNEDVRSDGYGAFPTNNNTAFDGATGAAGFTNVPEIGLKMQSVPVEAKARTLRAYWAFDASYELQKEYGQNIEDLLATQAAGEIAHRRFVA